MARKPKLKPGKKGFVQQMVVPIEEAKGKTADTVEKVKVPLRVIGKRVPGAEKLADL